MAKNSSFRHATWDPILIIAQIISLQALFYFITTLITLFLLLLTGNDITLDYMLNYHEFRADTVLGWTISTAWLVGAILGIYLLVLIVQRSRLILDFTLTLHFFHLLTTWYYSRHIPTTFLWWALNVTTACIMTFGGEWACIQKEMEPIMLVGNRPTDAEGTAAGGKREEDAMAGKGKGKYEMIPMDELDEDVGGS